MKKTLTSLLVGAACVAASIVQAAVPTGNLQSFTTQPLAADWSFLNVPGAGNTFALTADLDIAANTNDVAIITNRVIVAAGAAPGTSASAQWSQAGQYLVTRPTGNAYTILMARIQNTGAAINGAIPVSYDLGTPTVVANSEDPDIGGHHAYFSFTGLPGSWTPVPELTQVTPVAGGISASIDFGSWAAGAMMYLMWIDDNGGPAGDGSYSIDNFIIGSVPPPPIILTQPVGATNLVGRTVSLTVVADGSGLVYQWVKIGAGAIDTTANPSAATASLVITNAQLTDTADYYVSVSSPFGGVDSSSAHIQINLDTVAPLLLAARLGANPNQIILVVDEELCNDGLACGTVFTDLPILTFQIVNVDNANEVLGVLEATSVNTTNIILTTDTPWSAGSAYRITISHDNGGISDLSGNVTPAGTFVDTLPTVSFQQGVGGYAGTQDAGIHSVTDTADGSNPIINVDGADGGGIRQALLRFDDLFGPNPGQIPSGATISQATLTLNQTDNGDIVNLHRMLVGWDQNTVTWNIMTDGLTGDGVEAVAAFDAVTPGFNGVVGPITLDVTASVQAWAGGQPNYGWALIPRGGDGWRWNSSEGPVTPLLSVIYAVTPCSGVPTITANPPTAASVNEGLNLSIVVGVGNTCASTTFEWIKGSLPGTVVPGQTSSTLSIVGAVPSDAGIYRLRATNPAGSVTSDAVNVAVAADTTRPVLTRATGPNNTTVVLTFSKTLGAGATATSLYTVSGATVSAAVVANATVTLTTSARAAGNSTLTITGVTDNRSTPNLINPNPTTVALTTVQVIDAWNSTWSFNTNNLDGSPDWTTTGGAGWETGNALFGTETSAGVVAIFPTPIATVIPPNTNTPPDFVTAYFRKSVTLPALGAGLSYAISHIIDDGAVFYLDGVEFGRLNMASGAVAYATKATTTGEATLLSLPLTATAGAHTLAVEVHQGGATTSSDMVFGAQVIAIPTVSPSLSISSAGTNAVVNWTADATWQLVGSTNVAGPYAPVAGNPFRTLTTPKTQPAQFYELRYVPQP